MPASAWKGCLLQYPDGHMSSRLVRRGCSAVVQFGYIMSDASFLLDKVSLSVLGYVQCKS